MLAASDFVHHLNDFITQYDHYVSWSALEEALRQCFNDQLQVKSIELVKINPENESLYPANLKSDEDFQVQADQPFPLTLVHKNQHQQVLALTRIGQKKSKENFTNPELEAIKTLHRYLNQQVQHLKEKDQINTNLSLQTDKFQTARGKLQKVSQVKDNFLSVASHELRTPMSVIRGYTDFLLSENFGPINDQQKNFLEKIRTNTDQLTQLVNNMLDVSKLEAGKMEFSYAAFDLAQLIQETVKDHQILLSQKQQELIFKNQAQPSLTIKSDAEKIKLVLANLISNAYKFSPVKSAITITIKPKPESELWLIQVTDEGIGVSEKDRAGLFEKFQQVDNSLQKKHAGTGLGLSICREIVEALGGDIWIEDNQLSQTGSVFNFTLPA